MNEVFMAILDYL
jgi:hypothetical protein